VSHDLAIGNQETALTNGFQVARFGSMEDDIHVGHRCAFAMQITALCEKPHDGRQRDHQPEFSIAFHELCK
jgi:hypothetical protein